jgi:hypothetical protein
MPRWLSFVLFPLFGLYLVVVFSKDATLKRRLFPVVLIGLSGAFVAIVWTVSPLGPLALLVVPFVAGGFFLMHRAVRFCDVCGKTVPGASVFSRPRFCNACGAPLDARKPT